MKVLIVNALFHPFTEPTAHVRVLMFIVGARAPSIEPESPTACDFHFLVDGSRDHPTPESDTSLNTRPGAVALLAYEFERTPNDLRLFSEPSAPTDRFATQMNLRCAGGPR